MTRDAVGCGVRGQRQIESGMEMQQVWRMMLLREWRGSQTKEKRLLESKFFGAGSSNNKMGLCLQLFLAL
jgi:hypothetical protein